MNDRDDRILNHVGLYQITLRRVIEEQFFDGRSSGNVIRRLVAEKHLQVRDGLPGRLSYYQLTRTAAKSRGLPVSRARALQNQALHTALSVLWFCNMSQPNRHRLEQSELETIFPDGPPTALHTIQRETESHRLFRMKVVDPGSQDLSILRSLRKNVFQTTEIPGLRLWMQTGRYCFAILTETQTRVKHIRRMIQADEVKRTTSETPLKLPFLAEMLL